MKVQNSIKALSCAVLTILVTYASSEAQNGPLRNLLRNRMQARMASQRKRGPSTEMVNFGTLTVAVWRPPESDKPHPLVIFSHGFHGINAQSKFLMRAMADDGYLVLAPNHKDAMAMNGKFTPSTVKFSNANGWNETTYADRRDDIVTLISDLKQDPTWNKQIDWSNLILAGHSLGGYTVLGLAGAWPSWKIPGVKAVLALSPYAQPYITKHTLKSIEVPVMYEGGTTDFPITPTLKKKDGAFAQTSSPAYFVEFANANHLSFSDFNRSDSLKQLIDKYSLAFMDRYAKGSSSFDPSTKLAGVQEAIAK